MEALLPQVLAAVLGLIAAALAYRELTLRARRRQPPDDHDSSRRQ